MSLFLLAIPISGLIGSPLSTELLRLDGYRDLHGWQWMLLLEGLPAVVLGFLCLVFLPDRPRDVTWLCEVRMLWAGGLTYTFVSLA